MDRISLQTIFCIGLVLLLQDTLLAAVEDEANWYQVEILIFKNLEASAIVEEQWPHRVDSQYPSQAKRLQTDNQFRNVASSPVLFDLTASAPSPWQSRVVSELEQMDNSMFLELADNAVGGSTTDKVDESLDTTTEPPGTNSETPSTIIETPGRGALELTVPAAYNSLPDQMREFNQYAEKMRWSKNYRVLFHQSWRQAINDRTSNDDIVIESYSRLGDYPELQGTIRLSVSRYLHLQTQLWLNMLNLPWIEEEPRSTPPSPPKAYDPKWQFLPAIKMAASDNLLIEQLDDNSALIKSSEAHEQGDISKLDKRLQEQLDVITTSRYPYAGAVVMDQTRRMRSGEEHYIDHPLFGLIIKITPYEFTAFSDPELEVDSETVSDTISKTRNY